MTETANLGMPFIEGSQAQKHITHNEALRILDAAIQIGVLDTALTAPPSSPVEGARYIVAAGAIGDWAEQDDAIATFEDGAWRFLMPKSGWCAWSAADESIFVFDGTIWRDLHDLSTTLAGTSSVGVNATASDPNLLTVHSNAALFYAIAAADGGSGDTRLQISKEGAANTASVVFSDNFSGRAEFGLVESNAFKLKVSDDGATFVEALAIDQASGNATLPRGVALTGVIAPSQLTADADDYAPTGLERASVIRLSADAVRGVTGLEGGVEGRVLALVNTGAFAVILRDENAGSAAVNRFGFGTDLTLAASQGALLIYDGNAARWRQLGGSSASGGGSGAGATDSERQNVLLALVYQSKACAEYRRLVNLFTTGFKGASDVANGINTGASSFYEVDSSNGRVSLTTDVYANEVSTTLNENSAGWSGWTIRIILPPGSAASGDRLRLTLTPPTAGANTIISDMYVGHAGSGAAFDGTQIQVLFSSSAGVTLAAGGSSVVSDPVAYAYDSTKSLMVAIRVTSGDLRRNTGLSSSYKFYAKAASSSSDASGTSPSGFGSPTSNRSDVVGLVEARTAGSSSLTLVTATQTTDSSVSYARVLLEYDNAATPTLNTDLTVEVTCDGGSSWSSAALVDVTSHSQDGRKVVETADTACTAGTSFAARIKTLNNKNVPIYGATLSVH